MTTDDDDMGEFWRDVKAASQVKRAANRESSADALRRAGVKFETKNDGAHLIVTGPGGLVDFWPGTGLWKPRGTISHRRGVSGLIKFVIGVPA